MGMRALSVVLLTLLVLEAVSMPLTRAGPKARREKRRYCVFCRRFHVATARSSFWCSGPGYSVCKKGYQLLQRRGYPSTHPAWEFLYSKWNSVDATGCPIHSARPRADAFALRAIGNILLARPGWSGVTERIFALGFLLEFYWLLPMFYAANLLTDRCADMGTAQLRAVAASVRSYFKHVRVVAGEYVHTKASVGLCAFRPPAGTDRRRTLTRFRKLATAVEAWRSLCHDLSACVSSGRELCIHDLLSVMSGHDCPIYNGKPNYTNIRFCRALSVFLAMPLSNSEREWHLYRNMSASMPGKLKALGLFEYSSALLFCESAALKAERDYGLADLCVYVCLARA